MPTGYTADIKEGISFETFALNCARAFGACIDIKDEPFGGDKIPNEFKASDYNLIKFQEAKEKLDNLNASTDVQIEYAATIAWEEQEILRLKRIKEKKELRELYLAMLAKVNRWEPPTKEHEGLRDFMRDQILESIKFDCEGLDKYLEPKEKPSTNDWFQKQRARLEWDVRYYKDTYERDVQKAKERNEWVRALRESLQTLRR